MWDLSAAPTASKLVRNDMHEDKMRTLQGLEATPEITSQDYGSGANTCDMLR